MSTFEKRNNSLGMEFDRYVREHPEFLKEIPRNAQVVLLLEGDKEFNSWSKRIGRKQAEPNQPIIYITIKKLGPAHSRIEELSLATA
jgi:hypothetical protein